MAWLISAGAVGQPVISGNSQGRKVWNEATAFSVRSASVRGEARWQVSHGRCGEIRQVWQGVLSALVGDE